MNTKCFVIQPTKYYQVWLRRYSLMKDPPCAGENYHNAEFLLHEQAREDELVRSTVGDGVSIHSNFERSDPRWPTHCVRCGYEFHLRDEWQYHPKALYQRADDTGPMFTLQEAPVGSLWRNTWLEDRDFTGYCGTDGQSWSCKLPGNHDWLIDGRASNCTRPQDTVHKCWCRHGQAPNFHVDKNGVTCQAGAGSIAVPGYHGFLHNGELTGG